MLSHDLSTNALGRAHVLARLLHQHHEVEIVGPASSGEIWAPLRDHLSVPMRIIPSGTIAAMAAEVSGDLLYAVKERPESLGVALEARKQRPRPVMVDVDDWELGFRLESIQAMFRSRFREETKWVARMLFDVREPNSLWRTAWTERLAHRADAVTVSSTWLARRFGGVIIEHARDTSVLDPALFDRDQARAELGLAPDQTAILFMGSARRHKGLHSVVEALDLLGRKDITFLTVGGITGLPEREYIRSLGLNPWLACRTSSAPLTSWWLPSGQGQPPRDRCPRRPTTPSAWDAPSSPRTSLTCARQCRTAGSWSPLATCRPLPRHSPARRRPSTAR